jgi:hypothetical protein
MFTPDLAESKKKYYFCNELVEFKMTKYLWSGCTNVQMRDSVMEHANELITQLIRKQRLFVIYNGHDPSSFSELVHVAYMQIERTLYKYRARPHCRACFSYDRPNGSILYNPSRFEFGILKPYQLIKSMDQCPYCGADLKIGIDNIIEPQQGLYGGTDAILYRGLSKVFNMWCIAPDSMLMTNKGMMSIEDVIDNGITMVEGRDGMVKINGYMKKEEQDAYKIELKGGHSIVASDRHKFWVKRNKEKWSKTMDLEIGDKVAIQCGQNSFSDNDVIENNGSCLWLNEHSAFFIGAVCSSLPTYYNNELHFNLQKTRHLMKMLFDPSKHDSQESVDSEVLGVKSRLISDYCLTASVGGNLIDYMDKIGFFDTCIVNVEYIVNSISKLSRNIVLNFLKSYFGTSRYVVANEHVIRMISYMLLNLGIVPKIRQDTLSIPEKYLELFDEIFECHQPQEPIAKQQIDLTRYRKTVWKKIKKLSPIKSRLCEISVDSEDHSYIANGFISHNSQISRTVILAYVKKDTRDTRNGDNYTVHINKKPDNSGNEQLVKALNEAKNEMWFNEKYCMIVDCLIELTSESDSDKNLKRKIIDKTGLDKKTIEECLSILRVMMDLYSEQFEDGRLKNS